MTSTDAAPSSRIQERLRSLVVANRAIVAELSLDTLLRLVVESARTVVGAEYAVLEVVGPGGRLDHVIRSGTDRREATPAAGGVPPGGLSGVVPGATLPLRRSFSGPAGPSGAEGGIRSLLGVALGSAGHDHGNLFLANRLGGGAFSGEDESLVTALAATAAIALENALLYAGSHRRQQWLTASAEISQRLLAADVDPDAVLGEIASTVHRLAPADTVTIVVPDRAEPEMLEVVACCGQGAQQFHQLRYQVAGSIAWRAMQAGKGVLAREVDRRMDGVYARYRPLVAATDVMALPLQGSESVQGAIVVIRAARVPFTADDVEMAAGFAGQAALALELAVARREHQQLAVAEDRARIARDLHDHVVQKLFAVGLTLQGAAASVRDPVVGDRLGTTVRSLDETIRSLRTSIFELQTPPATTASLRSRLPAVLSELAPVLGFIPTLRVEGPLDAVARPEIAAVVESVLREAVTNIALHAEAGAAAVRLVTDGRRLTVTVDDDGQGLPEGVQLSGLAGLRERAVELGGELELGSSTRGGLLLTWSIPV